MTPSRGVSRFLAAHEDCGAGFQITRTGGPGRPRLRLLCQGCGQRAAYAAGDDGLVGDEAPPEDNGVTTVESPPPKADPGSGAADWLPAPAALPPWIPNVYILLVIGAGIALLAFGVMRQDDDGGGDSGPAFGPQQPAQLPAPVTNSPEPSPPVVAAEPPISPRLVKRAKAQLDPVSVLGRFTIGVPDGWSQGTSGGAVVFAPSDDRVELRIFLQPGAEPLNRLERKASGFLKREHPGARLAPADSLRLGKNKARELRVTFKGGSEVAVVLSAEGYTYLLLGRLEGRPPASREALMAASLHSFRTA